MKTRRLLLLSVGLYMVVGLVYGAFLFAGGAEEKKSPIKAPVIIQGTVQYLEGEVTINGKPADFGSKVGEGAEVKTGAASVADIVFGEKNILRLSENTIAVINMGELAKTVDLKAGSFSGIFAKLEAIAGDDKFEVRTPTAVAGIRGTTFFMRVINDDNTYVCACNGTVAFRDADSSEEFEVSAPKHEAYIFTKSNGKIDVQTAGEEFHTSAGLNAIADTVGVIIPWGKLVKESFKN